MPTREEKIAFIKSQMANSSSGPSREEKIAFIQQKMGIEVPEPESTQGQAALEGFGKGASLGYLPQIQAATEKYITNPLVEATTGVELPAEEKDYVTLRDRNIARQKQLAKDNPKTTLASEILGGVTTGIATAPLMPAVAPAATVGGRIAQVALQGAKAGATYGAVMNPGDEAGKVQPLQVKERIENAGKGAATGAATAGAIATLAETPAIAKAAADKLKKAIASKLGANAEFSPAGNKDEIIAAAKSLGIEEHEIPSALLTDNPTYQKLESGLSQSGSLPAKGTRDQYNNFFKKIDDAKEKISALKTSDSDFSLGQQIREDLAKNVGDKRKPVSELYNDLQPSLRKIPVDTTEVNKAFGALKRNPLFQSKDGVEMLGEFQQTAHSQGDLNSLKEWRSTLSKSVEANAAPIKAARMDAIKQAVTNIRDKSIMATKASLPESEHEVVDQLANQLALADSAHASNINELNSVKSIVSNKNVGSASEFTGKLSDIKEADLAERAANLDVSSLKNLKSKFPTVFEKAKTAKINDLVQSSSNPTSGFNENSFFKKYDGMDQELKDLIFDSATQKQISALKTVKSSTPPKLGPSGTPEGKMMMDMINPKRNAFDYAIKMGLDDAAKGTGKVTSTPSVSVGSKKLSPVLQLLTKPSGEIKSVSTMQNAADNDSPKKGPDKWAADGLNNLIEHSTDADKKARYEKLKAEIMQNPKLKKLVINASDLTPGSKAMEKLSQELDSKLGEEK
jgi:CRISPR/Cas system CSM-associated protein Csm2 small subunit